MDPASLSAALRSVADKIDRSENPSRSLVAAELRKILVAAGGAPAPAPAPAPSRGTKVVVSESWSPEDAKSVAQELGGTDLREGPYGDIGMVLPADGVAQLTADAGEDIHVFSSWLEASGDDPEYEFTPLSV